MSKTLNWIIRNQKGKIFENILLCHALMHIYANMHLNSCWESVKCFKIEIFFFASDSPFAFVIIFMFALTNSWLSCEADSSYIRKSDVAALSNTNLFSSHTYQMYLPYIPHSKYTNLFSLFGLHTNYHQQVWKTQSDLHILSEKSSFNRSPTSMISHSLSSIDQYKSGIFRILLQD